MELDYWKTRYFDILHQNQGLREQNRELSEASEQSQRNLNRDKKLLENLRNKLKEMKSNTYTSTMNYLCGLSSTARQSIMFGNSLKQQTLREPSSRKIPLVSAKERGRMFEGFYILGTNDSTELPGAGKVYEPEVLYRYPGNSSINDNILADFAFPAGFKPASLDMSESGSTFFSLVYRNRERDENTFIFTIRSNQNMTHSNLNIANKERESLYCCCAIIYENTNTDDFTAPDQPIMPKCYCLVSYYPCFELHFQVLFNILYFRKEQRMSCLSTREPTTSKADELLLPRSASVEDSSRTSSEMGADEIALLEVYYENFFLSSERVSITLQAERKIEYVLPRDLQYIDTDWICPTLFSLLEFNDFFKILCAIMHEKNVTFVSTNLDHISSCVLAYQCLIRPFKWPHLISPLLPTALHELLDAPVPLLAGVTELGKYSKNSHSYWVDLSNPSRVRVIGPPQVEFYGNNIKEYLEFSYRKFKHRSSTEDDKSGALSRIIEDLKQYWADVINKIPRCYSEDNIDFGEIKDFILDNTAKEDVAFVDTLIDTQMFINLIEDTFKNN